MTPLIRTHNLTRIFRVGGGEEVHAVDGVNLEIKSGTMTVLVGRSGSGKTTLLNLVSGLDVPTSGEVWFRDTRLDTLNAEERRKLRGSNIGFVFQSFGLLPLLTASENVSLPLRMRYMNSRERDDRVTQALTWVGLRERTKHRAYELSGGEQQRVAIARALAAQPSVLLADEPTGQLDSITGQRIVDLLRRLVDEQGVTVMLVTHDPKVMKSADVVHEMRDGKLLR